VILAGFHPHPPALLPRCYALCLPSDSEGMPNAVLEAMAAGLPVAATRVGGVPQLVADGVTGWLVEPGDLDGLAAALRRLLDDPAAARRMGQAGRQRAQADFSTSAVVPRLEAFYHGWLGGARRLEGGAAWANRT
jgi:glycosyltransferase involved in cell wall biosynthesis